jgi:acetyl/propionyl-CoA carboxylase alpha subunit
MGISDTRYNEVDYSNDILFCGGGGGNTNEQYEGFIFFKNECKRYSLEYENATHQTKSKIIDTIIETIHSVNKNSRFLERIKTTNDSRSGCILWKEIVGRHVHIKFYRAFAILRNDSTNTNTNTNDTNKTAGKINGMDQKQEDDDNTDTDTTISIDINNNNKNNNNEGNSKRKTKNNANANANANANENSSSSSNCTSMTTTRTSTKRIKFNNKNEKATAVARSVLPEVVSPKKNEAITITKKSVSNYLFYPFFIILY